MNEPFSQGHSWVHQLDSRVKLIGALGLILSIGLTSRFDVAALGLLTGFIFLLISRISLLSVTKRLASVNTFTLFLWITLPLTYGTPSFISLGSLSFSIPGIHLATLITLKTNALVLITLSLLATSTISNLGHGLHRLRLPTKLCYLLLYSYRYLFVIHQEYIRLLRAAHMRNFQPKCSLHTYQTYGYLFGMTLIKSWNRSQRVHQAMILRGFTGRLLPLTQSRLQRGDFYFLAIILAVQIIFLLIGQQA